MDYYSGQRPASLARIFLSISGLQGSMTISLKDKKRFFIIFAALFWALLFAPRLAGAAEFIVPVDYHTIQGAIDHAATGDTVIVEDGLYKENIVIKIPVVLRSRNGSERTIVEPVEPKRDVIRVQDVKVEVGQGGAVVTGFTLRGSAVAGLHIVKSPNTKVFRNNITGNKYGLHVEYSVGSIIKENVLSLNEQGLYLFYSDKSLIENNEVNSNTNSGILLHSSHKNTLLENVANSNLWNGITLSVSNDNLVRDNRALKNTYAIVVSESFGNEIVGNTTMPRLYYILPVALIYLAIMFYLIERKLFSLYYHYRYGE
jgi:nitrous oxidase accessory protein